MFIDERYGTMFEPGEWIYYPGRIKYPKQGIVIEAHYPEGGEAGWYKIIMDDGSEYVDYHFVFALDVRRTREERLKSIGIR